MPYKSLTGSNIRDFKQWKLTAMIKRIVSYAPELDFTNTADSLTATQETLYTDTNLEPIKELSFRTASNPSSSGNWQFFIYYGV